MQTRYLLGLLLLLVGCEDVSSLRWPEARFDPVPISRPLDLTRQLGTTFGLSNFIDTTQYRLVFDAATGRNIFIGSADDTVLVARIFRFREQYYFVQDFSNGDTWVHAVRIKHGRMQGFNSGYRQMLALSRRVLANNFTGLTRFRSPTNDSLRLRFNKRVLRGFYAAQIDSSATNQVIVVPRPSIVNMLAELLDSPVTGPYPNPARQQTTLDFATEANWLVTIYDDRGRRLRALPTVGSQLTFSVEDLPAGSYVLRISQPDGGVAPLTRRLLVER